MTPAKILLVADQAAAAEDLREKLEGLGYAVAGVEASTAHALRRTHPARPDAVLMDTRSCGAAQGLQAAAEIRRQLGVPVVRLTPGPTAPSGADPNAPPRPDPADTCECVLEPCHSRELRWALELAMCRQRGRNMLRECQDRYRLLLAAVPDAVLSFDVRTGRCVSVNEAASRLYGYDEREFLARGHRDLLAWPRTPPGPGPVDADLGVTVGYHRKKDETAFPVEVSATRFALDGEAVLCTVVRDITERRGAERRAGEHARSLEFLFRTAMGFVELPADRDIHQFIGEQLKELCGDAVVIVSSFDEASQSVCPCAIAGADAEELAGLTSLLGGPPDRMALALNAEGRSDLSRDRMLEVPGGLHTLCFGHVRRHACAAIEKLLDLGTTYAMGFVRDGRLFGSAAVLMRRGAAPPPTRTAEVFIQQASIALQRRAARSALRQSEERHRLLLGSAGVGIGYYNLEGTILLMNDKAGRDLGTSVGELIGRSALDVFGHNLGGAILGRIREIAAQRAVREYEDEVELPAGSKRFLSTYAPVPDASGRCAGVQIISQDITDRKRAEEDRRFQSVLLDQATDSIFVYEADGKMVYVNEAAYRTRGCTRQELLAIPLQKVPAPQDQPGVPQRMEAVLEKGHILFEVTHRRKDGSTFPVEVHARTVEVGGRQLIFAVVHDITDRERARQALRESRERLRSLAARLQAVREEERTLLARRIHDDVGHALAALKMDLAWLSKRLGGAPDVPLRARIQERTHSMSALLDETIKTVRQTASELRPGVLDDLGLAAALEWEIGQFQTRSGIQCRFVCSADPTGLDSQRATAIFRICQELLTNVARHSRATAATVSLRVQEEDNQLVLEVADNGKGIAEEDLSRPGSLGILGMRERALILSGELAISGMPGKGTVAVLRIPLGEARHPPQD